MIKKWINVAIVLSLMLIATIMLIIGVSYTKYILSDMMNMLSFPLYGIALIISVVMYNNNLLPNSIQRLVDDMLGEE